MESLGEERRPFSGPTRDSYDSDGGEDDEDSDEDEDDAAYLDEQDYHEQYPKEQGGANDDDASDEVSMSHQDDLAAVDEAVEISAIDNNNDEDEDEDLETEQDLPGSQPRQPNGRSRRRRLRRRRSESASNRGSESNVPGSSRGGGGGRRSPAVGPTLTTPFLTWLLWLEHCRRASEVERRSRAAARAFVARAGALGPVLEACCRVLREFQVGLGWDGLWPFACMQEIYLMFFTVLVVF